MEKLLHERLGEPDTELCIGEMLELIVTGKTEDCTGRLCGQCIVDAMNALADEIERTYTPNGDLDEIFADWIERMAKGDAEFPKIREAIDKWCLWRPRFEDGEPVGWYEDFVTDTGIASRLTTLRLDWAITDGSIDYLLNPVAVEDEDRLMLEAGEFVKRPTSKVYDADGVDYKRGEHVWDIEEGLMWRVKSFTAEKVNCERGDEEGWMSGEPTGCSRIPTVFTHERPVFDAEGVRIRKGDTVWHVRTGQKATVTTVYRDDQNAVEVEIVGHLVDYEPSDLTHREQDSLEKVIDEMNDATHDAGYQTNCTVRNWADRLTYFIERGA